MARGGMVVSLLLAAAVGIRAEHPGPLVANLVRLKDLGPQLVFQNGSTLLAAGRPGEGLIELGQFQCEGFNCHHMPLRQAMCAHDPAALEESTNIIWSCEGGGVDEDVSSDVDADETPLAYVSPTAEEEAGANAVDDASLSSVAARLGAGTDAAGGVEGKQKEKKKKKKKKKSKDTSGVAGSVFMFTPMRLECDSNVSADKGLAWATIDTMAVDVPGVINADPDRIYVDPATCRLTYTIQNLGTADEHLTLVILLFFSLFFAVVAICPAAIMGLREGAHRFQEAMLPQGSGASTTNGGAASADVMQDARAIIEQYENLHRRGGGRVPGGMPGGFGGPGAAPPMPMPRLGGEMRGRAIGNRPSHSAFSVAEPCTYPIDG